MNYESGQLVWVCASALHERPYVALWKPTFTLHHDRFLIQSPYFNLFYKYTSGYLMGTTRKSHITVPSKTILFLPMISTHGSPPSPLNPLTLNQLSARWLLLVFFSTYNITVFLALSQYAGS